MATACARCSRPSLKKIPETDAIFANLKAKDAQAGDTRRLSMDCKATVHIGDYCRGGKTRGDHRAADHDMGCEEKYTPLGIVDEDNGQLHLTFGSSAKTSDFIVDGLQAWWRTLSLADQEVGHPDSTRIAGISFGVNRLKPLAPSVSAAPPLKITLRLHRLPPPTHPTPYSRSRARSPRFDGHAPAACGAGSFTDRAVADTWLISRLPAAS